LKEKGNNKENRIRAVDKLVNSLFPFKEGDIVEFTNNITFHSIVLNTDLSSCEDLVKAGTRGKIVFFKWFVCVKNKNGVYCMLNELAKKVLRRVGNEEKEGVERVLSRHRKMTGKSKKKRQRRQKRKRKRRRKRYK